MKIIFPWTEALENARLIKKMKKEEIENKAANEILKQSIKVTYKGPTTPPQLVPTVYSGHTTSISSTSTISSPITTASSAMFGMSSGSTSTQWSGQFPEIVSMIKRYGLETVLKHMDIKDVEVYLRTKKLEKLKSALNK